MQRPILRWCVNNKISSECDRCFAHVYYHNIAVMLKMMAQEVMKSEFDSHEQ